MARPERIRLGDLLIQEQLLSAAQLAEALADQKSSGRKLGRIFVDRGWVTEAQIARSLARQLGAPFVDLGTRSIAPEMTALLPEARSRSHSSTSFLSSASLASMCLPSSAALSYCLREAT